MTSSAMEALSAGAGALTGIGFIYTAVGLGMFEIGCASCVSRSTWS